MVSNPSIDMLFEASTIRERCKELYDYVLAGKSAHWSIHPENLESVVDRVIEEMKRNYPDLNVPFHSRWRHFDQPRMEELEKKLAPMSPMSRIKAKYDVAIVSVLLDAGAGDQWRYKTGSDSIGRSEGLALASFDMIAAGVFGAPFEVRTASLQNFNTGLLEESFQVGSNNPLVGTEGRTQLLVSLGNCLAEQDLQRPGDIADDLPADNIEAATVLKVVLTRLGPIWPSRIKINDVNLGDVWRHHAIEGDEINRGLVPFHKLSQWLTYSLLEPLMAEGKQVIGVDQLTGLPEYRNGGLMIDGGLMLRRDRGSTTLDPDHPAIIEWRACTVILLDRIASELISKLKLKDFPLAKVLQGGTWSTGRKIAKEIRGDGTPPLNVNSDGTVF